MIEKEWFDICAAEPGPTVLILAGVHGDEYEPMVALVELFEELEGVVRRGRIIMNPLVNPSAYAARCRFGDDGLDVARICPGKKDGSPSERAAFAVSQQIQRADILIDLHTGGGVFEIYPLVGYMIHPNKTILEKQRQLAKATGMPLIWGTDHYPNGRTLSIARDASIPAIYLEYGGGSGFRQCVVDQYKIAVKRMLAQLGLIESFGMASRKWRYWLEDDRPNSGYLQGMMPAPESGIFIADTAVGDWIESGQRFGRIVNPDTGKTHRIFAAYAGLIFLVRCDVMVQQGDALGGIMPTVRNERNIIKNGKGRDN